MMHINMKALVLPIRGLQMFLAFVVLGLSGYVANWYNVETLTSAPTQISFLLFVSVFTVLTVVYLEAAPRFFPKFTHPYATLALESVNVLFYFAGMIALAVFLNTLLFCRGAVCGSAHAAAGMAGVQWLLFTATAVVTGLDVFKGGFRRPGRAGLKGPYPKEMKETSSA